jgi:signal peptidase I
MNDDNITDEISTQTQFTKKPNQTFQARLASIFKQCCIYLVVVVLSYGFFQFSHKHLLQTVQVDGLSMSPTLPNGKCYLLNRVVYMIREPNLKDIVVLEDPETHDFAIKRVIARPGDSVFMKNGQVFVNGKLLSESYLERDTKTFTAGQYRAALWVCGDNQFFVLGDNRNNSADSRVYGVVPRQNILGMVTP